MHISLFLQPSAVETDSEEYRTHNDTESEIEVAIQVGHYLDFILNSFRVCVAVGHVNDGNTLKFIVE